MKSAIGTTALSSGMGFISMAVHRRLHPRLGSPTSGRSHHLVICLPPIRVQTEHQLFHRPAARPTELVPSPLCDWLGSHYQARGLVSRIPPILPSAVVDRVRRAPEQSDNFTAGFHSANRVFRVSNRQRNPTQNAVASRLRFAHDFRPSL